MEVYKHWNETLHAMIVDKKYKLTNNNDKALREMQTLRACGSKAEPKKNFAQPQIPFPGAQDGQNLISWRWSLPLCTNPVCCGSMHTIRIIMVTDPQTNQQTEPITVYCAAASMQCNKLYIRSTLCCGAVTAGCQFCTCCMDSTRQLGFCCRKPYESWLHSTICVILYWAKDG